LTLTDAPGSLASRANPNPAPSFSDLDTNGELRVIRPIPAVSPAVRAEQHALALRMNTGSIPVVKPVKSRTRQRSVVSVVVMTFVSGLIGVLALPAYAVGADEATAPAAAPASLQTLSAVNAQTVSAITPAAPVLAHDSFSATSMAEIQAAEAAAAAAAAAEQARAAAAAAAAAPRATASRGSASSAGAYSGPSAAALVAAAPYAGSSPSQVVSVARQYIGVPYRFGGETPSGFDCSGLVKYVFAQFGVNLAHGVSAQGAAGTRISRAEAGPGDLVVWNDHSHIGIYTGNGNFIDAPRPGKSVNERPIWSGSVYFVRIGL
jgi:cell wall-associated NlpC family hydrolase